MAKHGDDRSGNLVCSFCGKSQDEVRKLIAGPTVYIQQQPGAPVQAAPQQYSYYCTDPAGYYPQVPNCNKPWLKVVPDGSPQPTPLPQ